MYDAVKQNVAGTDIKRAVSFYGKKYTFDAIFRYIDTLAENLKEKYGLGKGDTLTLCMPNSPSALITFYAANKLGAAVNLAHPYIPPEKLKESAEKTDSKIVVVYDAYPHKVRPDFKAVLLESDCGYFMGAAAKAYYRLTKKKLGWGESLENSSAAGKEFFRAREVRVRRTRRIPCERRHDGRAEDDHAQQLHFQPALLQGARIPALRCERIRFFI